MDKRTRIEELVEILNEANHAYYNEDIEIMSNYEYDMLYDELSQLETETGIIFPNSPTQRAGYEVVSKLKKVEHKHPALSLDKTKDRYSLSNWLKDKNGLLSWKMDGLTIVVTYNNGNLISAVTRGNGIIGEDVTHNAKHFSGLPHTIKHNGLLIVRGEAIMTYKEFERINKKIPESMPKYKNARNLASATVRLYDSKESAERAIMFYAFDLVENSETIEGFNLNLKSQQLEFLSSLGFNVVENVIVNKDTVISAIEEYENRLEHNIFPSDGLVLIFDDDAYGKSLGVTGKYPRNGIAFKWKDETVESTILDIEWSASRTGLLNPVAIFKPVELEGTTVERASIHNVSIAKSLKLGIGSTVSVYKANLIIPQISATIKSTGETLIPKKCPICGEKTEIKINDDIETLYCVNDDCPAKNIGRFTHFVQRDCMNIVGLSTATLEKFLSCGFLHELTDIYHLSNHKDKIVKMDGFGTKSYNNLISAIEESRNVKFSAFLASLGIAGIGKDMAKQISKALGKDALNKFVEMLRNSEDFVFIDGVGNVINDNIYQWKANKKYGEEFANLVDELNISDDIKETKTSAITGKTFVITGSVYEFKNRDELKEFIELHGGKTSGSVSSKTDYLINNDKESGSSKNKKAKELGVKIISEKDFLSMT